MSTAIGLQTLTFFCISYYSESGIKQKLTSYEQATTEILKFSFTFIIKRFLKKFLRDHLEVMPYIWITNETLMDHSAILKVTFNRLHWSRKKFLEGLLWTLVDSSLSHGPLSPTRTSVFFSSFNFYLKNTLKLELRRMKMRTY